MAETSQLGVGPLRDLRDARARAIRDALHSGAPPEGRAGRRCCDSPTRMPAAVKTYKACTDPDYEAKDCVPHVYEIADGTRVPAPTTYKRPHGCGT